MKKRILLTLLSLALVVSAVAVTAFAATIKLTTDALVVEYDEGTTPASPYLSGVTGTTMTISGIADITEIKYYKLGESADEAETIQLVDSDKPNGIYTIEGLVDGATYYVALKHRTVTSRESGDGNTYRYDYSEFVAVELASLIDNGEKWETPEGLSIVKNKLSGYTTGISYEYVKVNPIADEPIDETAYATLNVANTNFTAGLWAVRCAAGNDGEEMFGASDPVILYSRGADVGTFSAAVANYNAVVQGAWAVLDSNSEVMAQERVNVSQANSANYHSLSMTIQYADKDDFIDGTLYYAMTDDEIIPAEDFFSFAFTFSASANSLISNFSTEGFTVPAQVIFHTYGGSEESYSVDFSWKYGSPGNTIDLSSVADRDGYIYAIEIDLFTESNSEYTITENYTIQNINFSGGLFDGDNKIKTIKYFARGIYETPVLEAVGSLKEGEYVIKGFDPALDYMMSTDNITFTPVEDGVSSITVSETGRYYFYVKGDAYNMQSDTAIVNIQGAQPTMTGLVLDEATNTVSGFDIPAGLNVEWAKVTLGEYEWTTKVNNDNVTLNGSGLYAFRYKKNGGLFAGVPQYIYVRGRDVGTIKYNTIPSTQHSGGFLSGYWTTHTGGSYIDSGSKRLTAGLDFTAENATKLGFMYQLTNEEIFPISEFSSFSFSFFISQKTGDYYKSPFNAVLRIYVAGADVEYYDVNVSMNEFEITTFKVTDLWKNEVLADPNFSPEGYVIGLRAYLFDPAGDNNVEIVPGANATPRNPLQMIFNSINGNVINLGMKERVDVDAIRTVQAIVGYNSGDYENCGEIIGLNTKAAYQIARAQRIDDKNFTRTDEWINVPAGVSSIAVPAGDWAVRVYYKADDPYFVSSKEVCVTVLEADSENQRDSVKVPKVILPDDVTYANVDYIFDVDQTHWINRLTIENIVTTSPNATIVFETDTYRFTVNASDIDLSLSNAHYFDMKVTFDGESEYDRVYPKMAAIADQDELVLGIHFESTTGYFFETAVFEVNLGKTYEGMEVDLNSFNQRVSRFRIEETSVVQGGWATFNTFGEDYVILCPEYAEAKAE